jgi:hypothetical protein
MRGYPRFNFDAFENAEEALRSIGWNVISPHSMDLDIGFNPDQSLSENNFDLLDAVRRDVEAIISSEAIVMLPGWRRSKGARAERGVAIWLDRDIFYYGTLWERFKHFIRL